MKLTLALTALALCLVNPTDAWSATVHDSCTVLQNSPVCHSNVVVDFEGPEGTNCRGYSGDFACFGKRDICCGIYCYTFECTVKRENQGWGSKDGHWAQAPRRWKISGDSRAALTGGQLPEVPTNATSKGKSKRQIWGVYRQTWKYDYND
ncbi:uncharacterized protein VTP21DRAFT_7660 [Calcarisporiella thermophila]|uniref:uncharacterized protein n=1 Tax=Calcarisporiella thermophila TaxID=911321 RepID=UPI0037442640